MCRRIALAPISACIGCRRSGFMRTQLAHLRRVLPRHVAEGGRNLRGRRLQPDAHVGWTSTRHPSHEPEPRMTATLTQSVKLEQV